MNTLYAGFFVGELGWELMRWQGIVRHIGQNFDGVVIGCEKGHEYIYADFATDFVHYEKAPQIRNMWMCDKGDVPRMDVPPGAHYIMPSKSVCFANGNYHQTWHKYGNQETRSQNVVVCHARATENYRTGYRNWSLAKWRGLIECIRHLTSYQVYSIGTEAYHIPGTVDYRYRPLESVCNLLSGAKVCVGPSSGPMHLAALCACPVLVWTHRAVEAQGYTNRQRYKSYWNPFGTKAEVVDDMGWQPAIERVEECLIPLL